MSYQILINCKFCEDILNSRILDCGHLQTLSCLLLSTLYAMTVQPVEVYTGINMERRLLLIYSTPCQYGHSFHGTRRYWRQYCGSYGGAGLGQVLSHPGICDYYYQYCSFGSFLCHGDLILHVISIGLIAVTK